MKIFDCFMYFDEDLLLNLRLNILYDYVDQFLILEAKEDHQGNKRELNFNIDLRDVVKEGYKLGKEASF